MLFKKFFINASSDLNQLQNTINEGISVCNQYLELGGNPTFDPLLYLRTIRQSVVENFPKESLLSDNYDPENAHQNHRRISALKKFNLADTWTYLKLQYPQKANVLNELQHAWSAHAEVAHFTLSTLFEYHEHLEELGSLVMLSLKNYRKHKTSLEPLKAQHYLAYLNNLQLQLLEQKRQITESLFHRLRISLQNSTLKEVDILNQLQELFNEHQIQCNLTASISNSKTESSQSLPLKRIIQYIQNEGNVALNSALTSLFKTHGNEDFALTAFTKNNQFIPRSLNHYLERPSFIKRLFLWLFPGSRFRHSFFRDKQALLTQLWFSAQVREALMKTPDFNSTSWQALENAHSELKAALQSRPQRQSHWYDFLFQKSNALVSDWYEFLVNQHQQVTLKKIHWFKPFLNNPLPLEYLLKTPNTSQEILLKTHLIELEALLHEQKADASLWEEFNFMKNQLLARWCAPEPDYYQVSLSSLLSHLLTKGSMEQMIFEIFVDRLQKEAVSLDTATINNLLNQFETTLTQLQENFYLNTLNVEHTLLIHQLSVLLKHFSTNEEIDPSTLKPLVGLMEQACLNYKNFIQQQNKTWIKANSVSIRFFETALYEASLIHTDFSNANTCWISASLMRSEIEAGYTPYDFQSKIETLKATATHLETEMNALETDLKEANESTEALIEQFNQDNPIRLARQEKLFEELAQFGIFVPAIPTSEDDEDSPTGSLDEPQFNAGN